jgi:hypothetical protein
MILRLRGSGYFMVITPDGTVHLRPLEGTIEDLKWSMSKELGVSISRLTLVANGRTLSDGKTEVPISGTRSTVN